MVVGLLGTDWLPENPLGIGMPMGLPYPKPNFELGGIFGKDFLSQAEEIKAGLYGWIVYGALIGVHWSYFADRYYFSYTVSPLNMNLAFRTWNGVATWVRDITKTVSWGVTGFFWVCSAVIPSGTTFEFFAVISTYLLMVETFNLFFLVLMRLMSFFMFADQYENDYHNYLKYDRRNY